MVKNPKFYKYGFWVFLILFMLAVLLIIGFRGYVQELFNCKTDYQKCTDNCNKQISIQEWDNYDIIMCINKCNSARNSCEIAIERAFT